MAPLVSVIIPTWNRRTMLCEAIDSVLKQRSRCFELLVVDDGSEDGTARELERYGALLRCLRQETRLGPGAARNLGARMSSGKYLAFLDSDDLWLPKKLERQVDFLESSSGARICQTEEIWLRGGVRVNPKEKHRKPSGDIFRESLALCLVSPSAVMMRRDLFDEIGGFDEDLPLCEDYDLWLRISLRYPVALIPEFLVIKRGGHENQLSRSTWGLDRFRIRALEKLLRSGLDGERKRCVLEVLRKKATILGNGARKRGKESEAVRYDELVSRVLGGNSDVAF